MSQHPNAKLTRAGRKSLFERFLAGEPVSKIARETCLSAKTVRKWVKRAEAGEDLCDRSSRPKRCPRKTDEATEVLVVATRIERHCNCFVLSAITGVPARTCARIVARNGCPKLSEIDPVTGEVLQKGPVTHVRYERDEPGDLVHVDVKKLPSIPEGGGFRVRGARKAEHAGSGKGTRCLHVAVDDRSRVCFAELLDNERKETCVGFLLRARDFFRSIGVEVKEVMTDNGPAYRSKLLNEWMEAAGIGHIYTRVYSPWQNGKVERMNRTLSNEWAYAMPYGSEEDRETALPAFLRYYNETRPHSACGGKPPMSRIGEQRLGT